MGTTQTAFLPGVYYDRAISAWKVPIAQREQGMLLLQNLKPGDHVIFYSICRGFRNIGDWHGTISRWRAAGIYAHFVSDNINLTTAYGRAHAAYIAVAAELYADLTGERTREAAIIRKMRGSKSSPRAKTTTVDSDLSFASRLEVVRPAQSASGTIYMYERCSSNAQYISGLGMQVQSESNLRYAKSLAERRPGLVVCETPFSDEAVSSFSVNFRDRPAGKKVIETLRAGDHLVVYRLDRAWRSTSDAINMVEDFMKRGITVHMVKEGVEVNGPQGEQWVAMMSSFAKLESLIKSRRKLEINEQCKLSGRPWNWAPRGYKIVEKDSIKRMVCDRNTMAIWCIPYVLHVERGYTATEAAQIAQALHFHRVNRKPYLCTHKYRLNRAKNEVERWKKDLPPAALEGCFKQAREWIDRDIPAQFKKLCPIPQPWLGVCAADPQPLVNF